MQESDTRDHDADAAALPNLEGIEESKLLTFLESALERFSVESLTKIGETVREKRQAKQDEARITARQKIEEQLRSSGLSIGDLFPELVPSRSRGEGGTVPPKYRGPNGETWSGRGHQPKWLTALEADGRKKDEFLIRE